MSEIVVSTMRSKGFVQPHADAKWGQVDVLSRISFQVHLVTRHHIKKMLQKVLMWTNKRIQSIAVIDLEVTIKATTATVGNMEVTEVDITTTAEGVTRNRYEHDRDNVTVERVYLPKITFALSH